MLGFIPGNAQGPPGWVWLDLGPDAYWDSTLDETVILHPLDGSSSPPPLSPRDFFKRVTHGLVFLDPDNVSNQIILSGTDGGGSPRLSVTVTAASN